MPYMHRLSHNLKRIVSRPDVPMVFSTPRQLDDFVLGSPLVKGNPAVAEKKSTILRMQNERMASSTKYGCLVGNITQVKPCAA